MKPNAARFAACCALALLLLPAAGRADVRSAIQTQYDRFNASLVGRNIAALTAVCTADCKLRTRPRRARALPRRVPPGRD